MRHTRVLKLEGGYKDVSEQERRRPKPSYHWDQVLGDADELEPGWNPVEYPYEKTTEPAPMLWAPVETLLENMRHLTGLFISSPKLLPSSLVQALHKYHPQCRLDMGRFRFQSFDGQTIAPGQNELLTSPCLHGMTVRHSVVKAISTQNFNQQATLQTIACLAPNLKKVRIYYRRTPDYSAIRRAYGADQEWNGFRRSIAEAKLGALELLVLAGYAETTRQELKRWNRHTDMSKLRGLSMSGKLDEEALKYAAEKIRFSSLERLVIVTDDGLIDDMSYQLALEMFMNSLNPLSTLRARSLLNSSTREKIFQHHGSGLRELDLEYGNDITLDGLHILHDKCPKLEMLTITITRTLSDDIERQCYEVLGTCQSLRKVTLFLKCTIRNPVNDHRSPYGIYPPSEDSDDEFVLRPDWPPAGWRHGCVRDNLLNSAVDENLARSIWDLMHAKRERELDVLKILTRGSTFYWPRHSDFPDVIRNISRSYLLTPNERDDSNEIEAIEIGKEAREERDTYTRELQERARFWDGIGEYGEDTISIFTSLWPIKDMFSDWRIAWCSRPLIQKPGVPNVRTNAEYQQHRRERMRKLKEKGRNDWLEYELGI